MSGLPNVVGKGPNLGLPNVVDAVPSETAVVVSESKEERGLPNVVDTVPSKAAVVSESKEEGGLPNVVDTYVSSSGNNSSASNSATAPLSSRLDNFPEEYDPDRYAAEEKKLAIAKAAAGAGAGAREVAVAKLRQVRLMVRPRALKTINETEEKSIWRDFVISPVKTPYVFVFSFFINKPITYGRGSFFIGTTKDKVSVTNSDSAKITDLADPSIDTLLNTAVGKINDNRSITHLCIYINFENAIDYVNLNTVVRKVKEIGAKYGIELLASKGEPSSSSGYMKMTPTDEANMLFIGEMIAGKKDLPYDAKINYIIKAMPSRRFTISKDESAALQDFVNNIKGKGSSSGANNSSAGSSGGARRTRSSRSGRKTRKTRKTKSRKSHKRR